MMLNKLPSLDLYNDAVQNPRTAFIDSILQSGQITTNGLGLPEPTTGGFAITYQITANGRKFAVRVFHKATPDLEGRYRPISSKLKGIKSEYLVDFEFQANGIRISGQTFPIVKMDWISGETLGGYLEGNYRNSTSLQAIRSDIQKAGAMLANSGIAHGDLQTGNILVAGNRIKLIDYDGMYVPEIPLKKSSELGQRHFQHPQRNENHFDSRIDRFSLILLDLSLEAVATSPKLFEKFATSGENIVFTAGDLKSPGTSAAFKDVRDIAQLRAKTERFAALCCTPFDTLPTFEEFNSGKWTPSAQVVTQSTQQIATTQVSYQGAYDVVDASNFSLVRNEVGNKIELIGKVTEIKEARTRHGRPYVFVNFGPWQGNIVKITIWDSGLKKLRLMPSPSWVGQWISVTGLIDSPYTSKRYKYTHVGITVSEGNQVHLLTNEEASFRLGRTKKSLAGNDGSIRPTNRDILKDISPSFRTPIPSAKALPQLSSIPSTRNQQILDTISKSRPTAPPIQPQKSTPTAKIPDKRCFIATACYIDVDHTNLVLFRAFRDEVLGRSKGGTRLIEFYYRVGPEIAKFLERNKIHRQIFTSTLDIIAFILRSIYPDLMKSHAK